MSDKKNLLNEGQVRQFMKLARLEPLTTGFVEGLTTTTAKELEETHGRGTNDPGYGADNTSPGRRVKVAEAEAGPGELEDFAADDLADDSVEGDEEAAHDELEADAELGTADEGRTVSVDDFLAALESALESAMGDEVEVDASEMEVEEVPMDDEMEVDDVEVEDDMLAETGAKDDGESKGDKGKDKDDPSARDYEDGGDRKGDESKTHKGEKDYTTKKGDKLKHNEPGGRGEKKGDKAYVNEATDELVEAVTKRVAARILKSALAKK